MSLFNMNNLMNVLMQPDQHEEGQNLASKAGVDKSDFAKIAAIGLPLILQGMNRNNQSQKGLESFNQALNQHQGRNNYDSLNQFAKNVDAQEGDKILNHVFSNEKEEVNNSLANQLGLNPDTVKKGLAILAPIAIKYLADRKREQNLDPQGVQRETDMLTREMAKQAKNQSSVSSGLIDNFLGGLTGSSNNQKNDGGLLGSLMDLFK